MDAAARRGRRTAGTAFARAALVGTIGLAEIFADGEAQAAPLRPYTAAGSAGRALVLDQDGRRIALPRPGRELGGEATPTYLAYRVTAATTIPAGLPSVPSATGRGAVGPLRLDAQAIRAVNAGLAASNQVTVTAGRQEYLVTRATSGALSDASAQYWRAAVAGRQAGDSVGETVKGWYRASANAVDGLGDKISDALNKAFNPDPPKAVALYPPVRKAAAQVLVADAATAPEAAAPAVLAQEAPVPEPAAWLAFAGIAALGLRLRSRSNA